MQQPHPLECEKVTVEQMATCLANTPEDTAARIVARAYLERQWMPIDGNTPKNEELLLAALNYPDKGMCVMEVAMYQYDEDDDTGEFEGWNTKFFQPTHWMPLPAAPEVV